MAELTEQDILDYIAATESEYTLAGNEFGTALPDEYKESNEQKQLGYREDQIADFFKLAGIYPEDLLGLEDAPERPEAPRFESDILEQYSGNPLMEVLLEDIGAGVEPSQAVAAMKAEVESGNPAYAGFEQFIPINVDTGKQEWNAVTKNLAAAGPELRKQNREQAAYDSEEQAYQDYVSPSTQFEQAGSPDRLAALGQLGIDPGRFMGAGNAAPVADDEGGYDFGGFPSPSLEPESGVPGVQVAPGQYVFGGRESAPLVPETVQFGGGVAAPLAPNAPTSGSDSPGLSRFYNRIAQQRIDAMKGMATPSGEEQELRQRLGMAYTLLHGTPPPVRQSAIQNSDNSSQARTGLTVQERIDRDKKNKKG